MGALRILQDDVMSVVSGAIYINTSAQVTTDQLVTKLRTSLARTTQRRKVLVMGYVDASVSVAIFLATNSAQRV